jgi:excisionase family DNA binding protein
VNTPEPAYLTILEAIAYLRTSRRNLYHLIRHGEIATIKRGARRFVVFTSLRAYAEREQIERGV